MRHLNIFEKYISKNQIFQDLDSIFKKVWNANIAWKENTRKSNMSIFFGKSIIGGLNYIFDVAQKDVVSIYPYDNIENVSEEYKMVIDKLKKLNISFIIIVSRYLSDAHLIINVEDKNKIYQFITELDLELETDKYNL